jgi:hypothetical protein
MICAQELLVRISTATIHIDSWSLASVSPRKYQHNITFNQDKKPTFLMISSSVFSVTQSFDVRKSPTNNKIKTKVTIRSWPNLLVKCKVKPDYMHVSFSFITGAITRVRFCSSISVSPLSLDLEPQENQWLYFTPCGSELVRQLKYDSCIESEEQVY